MLLVAKLDRLARSIAFLASLTESRVRFQAVDLPAADEFILHILAAVAKKEAAAISKSLLKINKTLCYKMPFAASESSFVAATLSDYLR